MDKKLGDSAPPMREVVYRRIRENILLGVYQPGGHLKEAEIASNLGVSRTPVREALRRLKAEHFLVNEPHCGMVVSSIATGSSRSCTASAAEQETRLHLSNSSRKMI